MGGPIFEAGAAVVVGLEDASFTTSGRLLDPEIADSRAFLYNAATFNLGTMRRLDVTLGRLLKDLTLEWR